MHGQAMRRTSLTLASFTDRFYQPRTDRQRRGCNLKTKAILRAPRQGWEMSADTTTKMCPSFSPEKGSFHFINSRLKRNYLPIDPNRQHKGNRTKKRLLLSALKFFFYVVAFLFSVL